MFLHVGNGAAILADKDSLGAVFLGGANNNNVVIDQGGNVDGYSSANRLAFASWDQTMTDQGSGPDAANILLNGYVGGGALLGNGSTINIGTTGTMAFGDTVNLGTSGAVNNGGMVEVGPVGMVNTTTLTGNFKQVAGGTILFDVDLANGQADRLELATGSATIAGSIASNLINVQAGSVVVMTTRQGTITLDPSVQWTTTSAYEFKPVLSVDNTVLSIQATADFTNVEGGLNKAQSKVASHLQEILGQRRPDRRERLHGARQDQRSGHLQPCPGHADRPGCGRHRGGALRQQLRLRQQHAELSAVRGGRHDAA